MAEGGEGEDEIQFLRTVSAALASLPSALCRGCGGAGRGGSRAGQLGAGSGAPGRASLCSWQPRAGARSAGRTGMGGRGRRPCWPRAGRGASGDERGRAAPPQQPRSALLPRRDVCACCRDSPSSRPQRESCSHALFAKTGLGEKHLCHPIPSPRRFPLTCGRSRRWARTNTAFSGVRILTSVQSMLRR